MRIISFATEDSDWQSPRMGILLHVGGHDTGYRLDCEKLFDKADRPANPLAWFDMDGPWFQKARETHDTLVSDRRALAEARDKGWLVRSEDAYWFAPVPRPGKIICIGLNYRDHAAESNMPIPEKPVVFSKFSTCVIAPGEPVVLPSTSHQVDYEAELAVVIGRRAKHVTAIALTITCLATPLSTTSPRAIFNLLMGSGNEENRATRLRRWAKRSSPQTRFPIRTSFRSS